MQCEFETLAKGTGGRLLGFIRCSRRATFRVSDDRSTMTHLCSQHKGLVNRRLRKTGQPDLTAVKL